MYAKLRQDRPWHGYGRLKGQCPDHFRKRRPDEKGHTKDGRPIDLATAFEAVGKFETKEIDEAELRDIECNACPSGGQL